MSEGHIVPIRATIGEYRFRYLVVGCAALVFASITIITGAWLALLAVSVALERVALGFVVGSTYVIVVCVYHISLFRRKETVYTHPLTPLGGVAFMLGMVVMLGWSLMLLLGFLGSSLLGYFVLTGWEKRAGKKVLVMNESLWRSKLSVVDGSVRVVYVA